MYCIGCGYSVTNSNLCIVYVGCGYSVTNPNPAAGRIVGGVPVSPRHKLPYQVLLTVKFNLKENLVNFIFPFKKFKMVILNRKHNKKNTLKMRLYLNHLYLE